MAWTSPDTPAAGSQCPMLDLPALMATSSLPLLPAAPFAIGCAASTALAAPTSMGSPRAVPVPCMCRLLRDRPASMRKAARITLC